MTRHSFGAEITQAVVSPDAANGNALVLAPGATVAFFDADGGDPVTDFLLWNPTTGTYDVTATAVTATTGGTLPRFQGPDGLTELWTQDSGGTWLRLRAYDAAGGGTDTDAVHKSGDETIDGIKTFTSPPNVPDDSFEIAAVTGLQDAIDAAGGGEVPDFSENPVGATGALRRTAGTLAVATATQGDEAPPLSQVKLMVGELRELELSTDKSAADNVTWITLDDLAITNAATGQLFSCEYDLTYEASATGGIAFRFSIGSPGLTVAGWTVRGRYMGAKLSPTLTTTPSTSEDFGRRMTVRYGSAINSDTGTNPTISGTFGGLGAGVPVDLWVVVKVKVVGAGITNGLIRPEFRQKALDGATPTVMRALQSTATLARVA